MASKVSRTEIESAKDGNLQDTGSGGVDYNKGLEQETKSSSPAASTPEVNTEQKSSENNPENGEILVERTTTTQSIGNTMSPIRQVLFVTVICLVQFTTQAALGQTIAILQVIGDHFKLDGPSLSWLIAGYSLTVGTFILAAGRFGDMFGYKRMLMVGFVWFALWSMVVGVSYYSGHVLFIFARVLQGIGPAICMPNGLAILGATYPPGLKKAMIFALFGATAPGGHIAGAAFASLFALTSWPWAFYSLAIALVIIAGVAAIVVPDPPPKETVRLSFYETIVHLDLIGASIGITALVLFNFAWNQAPIVGWQKAYVYITLILGCLLVPIFFWYELRVAKYPIIPFHAFSPDVAFVLACVACGWADFGIFVYYLWQEWELLDGLSPLLATAWISPAAISGACASIATGYMLHRIGPAWVMTVALFCFTIGTILIATRTIGQTYWAQCFVAIIVIPWGMDMSFPAATLILSNSVAREHQGIAASLVATIVNYSISLGLGFAGTVESHINKSGTGPEDLLKGFRAALYMAIGLAGLGVAISLVFLGKTIRAERRSKQSVSAQEKAEEA